MKKLYFSFFYLILTAQFVTAQWYLQQSGTTENLESVYFVDQNTGWVCGSNGTIIKTTNGGLNWIAQNSNTADYLKSIQFADQSDGWAYGDTSRISTNNGGTTWSASNISSNFVGQQFFKFPGIGWVGWVVLQSDPIFIEVYRYYFGWLAPIHVPAGYCDALFFLDENNGWITSVGFGNVLRTTDGGSNWAYSDTVILGSPTCIRFTTPLIGWVSSNTLGNSDISKSTDGGVTWFSQITGGLNEFINSISFPDSISGYAVGFQIYTPPIQDEGFIIKTASGGTYWEEQYRDNGKLNSVFFVNENRGWAVGDGGKILATANGGTPVELNSFTASVLQNEKAVQLNWSTATETNHSGFEIERLQDSKIERLKNWETIGFVPGFGTTTEPKSYSFTDENITTGTYKYRLKQIDFDGTFEYSNELEVAIDFTPKEFVLYQNFPNPFNPSTTIKYSLPVESFVKINIYNALGEVIEELVSKVQSSGNYEVTWNAQNYSSGIYYYSFEVNSADGSQSHREMKKIVFLK
jgi:photosystem II stability/assembly factor-like uncharacterized protein